MPAKKKDAKEVCADVNKKMASKYGRKVVVAASDVTNAFDIRLPTGLPGLDLALEGGFPRGIVIEFAGLESAGKNALAYQTAGTYQRMQQKETNILLCPVEGEIDKRFARKMGFKIPLSKIELAREEHRLGRKLTKEEIEYFVKPVGKVDFTVGLSAEDILQTVVDYTMADEYGLVVVDSVSAMISEDDLERKGKTGAIEQVGVGGERPYGRSIHGTMGSFLNRFVRARKNEPKGRLNLTTVIVINQVRADMSGHSDFKVAGAQSLKHYKRAALILTPGPWLKDEVTNKVIGHVVYWSITKGQYGVHEHARGAIKFYYATGFDVVDDLFGTLHERKLAVHQGGGNWDLIDSAGEVVRSYGKDVGGKDGLIQLLRNNEDERGKWLGVLNSLYETPPLYEGDE
jgi:RecA/RadA recombinase